MEITYDGTNWSINNDSLEPDFAIHATISATAVANSIAIGYYDFGVWVNGWSFPNTYTSGDVPASVISGSWASSFVSMIEQGSSSTPTFNPANFGADLDIYCTPTNHPTHPSHSNDHGFARYSASDVSNGGTIEKYAYRLFDSSNQSSDGYANHEICIDITDNNTWKDLGTQDPIDLEEVGTTTKYIKCTYGNGAVLYFENKASWYS